APDLGAFEYGVMTPIETIPNESADIEIYCNADKNLTVNGKLANIEIYSLSGAKLYSQSCSSENITIPVLNLSKNIYLVRVILKNGTSLTRKLLIY
ncbi:MAG: T9SS type A sorting domain-containing protein, partial [Paludibacter sp.]